MPDLLLSATATRSLNTLAQMIDRVRGDTGKRGYNFVTDAEIIEWLWEAQTIIARETEWYLEGPTAVSATAGTSQYAFPARAITIHEVIWDGVLLDYFPMRDFNRYLWNWREAANGTPTMWSTFGTTAFRLHVPPDTTSATLLEVVFTGLPPKVSTTTETLYVPYGRDDALIIYGKYMLSMKDAAGEGQRRVEQYKREWMQALQEIKGQVGDAAEEEILTVGGHRADYGPYDYDVVATPPVGYQLNE